MSETRDVLNDPYHYTPDITPRIRAELQELEEEHGSLEQNTFKGKEPDGWKDATAAEKLVFAFRVMRESARSGHVAMHMQQDYIDSLQKALGRCKRTLEIYAKSPNGNTAARTLKTIPELPE